MIRAIVGDVLKVLRYPIFRVRFIALLPASYWMYVVCFEMNTVWKMSF